MTTSLTHRQPITRVHVDGLRTLAVAVEVDRDAMLSDTLDRIAGRRTRGIIVRFGDGHRDATEYRLTRAGAVALADALGQAIVAMDAVADIDAAEAEAVPS